MRVRCNLADLAVAYFSHFLFDDYIILSIHLRLTHPFLVGRAHCLHLLLDGVTPLKADSNSG